MLHLDRNGEEYLRRLDEEFTTTPLISVGIEFEIKKVFEEIEYDWERHYERVKKGLRSWENKLTKALSNPIPARYVGKPRPYTRLFPYAVSGDLKRSWTGWAVSVDKNSVRNQWTLKIESGFMHEHAMRTNRGDNSTRDVHWLHWADDVFGNPATGVTQRRGGVPDLRAVLLGYYS